MSNGTPKAVLVKSAFGNEKMDMRIPFEVTAKGMQDTDKTGNKISLVVEVVEETGNDLINSLKKAVKKGTVRGKERPKFLSNGKDTVAMRAAS